MEFLFLNESAVLDQKDYLDSICESINFNAKDSTESFADVMLEATEDYHNCEVTCMQEEFQLFCEENSGVPFNEAIEPDLSGAEKAADDATKKVGSGLEKAAGVDGKKAGFFARVAATLKKWWNAIKNFIAKIWNKILYVVDKVYAFCVQLVKRITAKKGKVKAPKDLGTAMNLLKSYADGDAKEAKKIMEKYMSEFQKYNNKILAAETDLVRRAKEDFDKAEFNSLEGVLKFFKDVGADNSLRKKYNKIIDLMQKEAGKTVEVDFQTYKTWCDVGIKVLYGVREVARIIKKQIASITSTLDGIAAKIEKNDKPGSATLFKIIASAAKKVGGFLCSILNAIVSGVRSCVLKVIHLSMPKSGVENAKVKELN